MGKDIVKCEGKVYYAPYARTYTLRLDNTTLYLNKDQATQWRKYGFFEDMHGNVVAITNLR